MYKSRINAILITVLLFACAAQSFGQTVAPAGSEGKLIAVLKSKDASYKEKVDACRQLAIIATKDAVPVLAELLADEKLSHMARYAIETIPDASVDLAFRDALGKLKGRPLVGLIGSIGVRGKCQGVFMKLIDMLGDPDPDVAQAAARALGKMPSRSSHPVIVKGLTDALEDASGAHKLAICEGLFRCAESFTEYGNRDQAIPIYDRLLKLDAPHQVRAGALRGALLTRSNEDALPLLRKHLRNTDYIMFSAAVQAAQEMSGSGVTKVLCADLKKLSADNQILIFQTLGKRADPAASASLAQAAKSGPISVRIAAIEALAEIGDASAVGPLTSLLADSDSDIAEAAQEAFASIRGKNADAAIMDMLTGSDTDIQLKAFELIGRRRMTNVAPALLKAARDNDESVRTAAIRTLGDLGDTVNFPVLLDLLLNASGRQEILAAERALSTACTRRARLAAGKITIRKAVYGAVGGGGSADVTRKLTKIINAGSASVTASNANFGDPASGIVKQLHVEYSVDGVAQTRTIAEGETVTLAATVTPKIVIDQLSSALAKAPTRQKIALLRILRNTQDPTALQAVRAATKDSNTQVAGEAVSMLCGWPTADALGDVLQLTGTASDPKTRILALRGAIRLIPLQAVSVDKKLEGFREILSLVQRNEEKKLLLGALAGINSPAAVEMILPHLDNPATKAEAATAILGIAENVLKRRNVKKQQAAKLISPLEKVAASENAPLAKRAKALLKQAKNKAG